jgi:hypothetical protein
VHFIHDDYFLFLTSCDFLLNSILEFDHSQIELNGNPPIFSGTPKEVQGVEGILNIRPRKSLKDKTPKEIFLAGA